MMKGKFTGAVLLIIGAICPLGMCAKNNASVVAKLSEEHIQKREALSQAIKKGALERVKSLIHEIMDRDMHSCDFYQLTPLCEAVSGNKLEILKWLLDAGLDMEMPSRYGETPMTWAIKSLKEEDAFLRGAMVQLLIKAGADVNRCNAKGETPVYLAAANPFAEPILRVLIAAGVDVNSQNIHDAKSPLMGAVASKNLPSVSTLIQSKADLHVADRFGFTALSHASMVKQYKMISVLVDAGADIDAANRVGMTPLMWAVYSEDIQTVKALLKNGAHPERKTFAPFNLGHFVPGKQKIDVLPAGSTPLSIAEKIGATEIAKLLKAAMGQK